MRVMLADDHRIVREGIRWMLDGESDIDVVAEASDGREVLEALAATEVDVLLLDVRMPGLGGLDALEELRTRGGLDPPRVIVLSMYDESVYVRRAIELGARGYLLKEVTREELLTALRSVAAGGSHVQAGLTGELLDLVAHPEEVPAHPSLTARELEVLALVAEGCRTREIARRLGIAETTVKTHLDAAFRRLDVSNRAAAVAAAMHLGLLE